MRDRLFSFEIPRRSRTCTAGGEPLTAGMEYFSMLQEGDNGEWQRCDFCSACWTNAKKQGSTHWKSQVPKEQSKLETQKHRNERALELLRNGRQSTTESDIAECFVLGLYLARCRVLALRQQMMHEGERYSLYEVVATEEMLPVRQVPLSQLQVEQLQEQIAKKLC